MELMNLSLSQLFVIGFKVGLVVWVVLFASKFAYALVAIFCRMITNGLSVRDWSFSRALDESLGGK